MLGKARVEGSSSGSGTGPWCWVKCTDGAITFMFLTGKGWEITCYLATASMYLLLQIQIVRIVYIYSSSINLKSCFVVFLVCVCFLILCCLFVYLFPFCFCNTLTLFNKYQLSVFTASISEVWRNKSQPAQRGSKLPVRMVGVPTGTSLGNNTLYLVARRVWQWRHRPCATVLPSGGRSFTGVL